MSATSTSTHVLFVVLTRTGARLLWLINWLFFVTSECDLSVMSIRILKCRKKLCACRRDNGSTLGIASLFYSWKKSLCKKRVKEELHFCMQVTMVTYKRERDRLFSCFFPTNMLPWQPACKHRYERTLRIESYSHGGD